MDLFNLSAKISLDASEFDAGLKNASGKFSGFASSLKKGLSGAESFFKPAVEGFQAVETVGKKTGDVVMSGVKGFMAASTAVAGFGGTAVKAGMDFDAAMSQVSAVSGATGEDFKALRNKAIEMGASTQFSASEAAEAFNYMAMAGWKTGDMLGGIEGIMNLAAASGEDLARTSDIVTDAMTAFGLSADGTTKVLVNGFEKEVPNASHFADALAVAASNANTNVDMMGETFKYVAPVAGTLGYSIEDTALAIGLMANSGIKASQGGTALRSIMNRIATDAGASSKSLGALGILTEKLGVEFYNADGSARDLNSVLMESREAWKELTVQEQENYAKKIAGEEAGTAWMAMMNASNADVQKLTSSLIECNGAAGKMAATMMDNLAGDMKLFKSALESLQISISDALNPTLREFAQFGTKAMEQLTKGFQSGGTKGFFSALTGIVTQATKFLAEKAPEFVKVSWQFVESLATGILDSGGEILAAAGEIINILITGVGTWLGEHGEELAQFGMGMVDTIFQGFSQAGDLISENIGQFIPLIANAFLSYHESLFTVGIDILGAIGRGLVENKDKIMEMASSTVRNIALAIAENAPAIIDGAIVLLEALANAVMENWPLIAAVGMEIIAKLVEGITTNTPAFVAAIALLFPHITKIIDVASGILGVVGKIVSAVTSGIGNILDIGKTLMSGIQGLFSLITAHPVIAVITAIVGALIYLWNNCEEFREAVQAIWEAIVSFFQAAGEAIQAAWVGIVDFFQGVWDGIVNIFQNVGQWFSDVFSAAGQAVQDAWGAIVAFFQGIWDGIVDIFQGVAEWFGSIFSAAWDAIKSVWDAVLGFFGGIADGIHSAFEAVTSFLSDAFSAAWDLISGVWEAAVGFFSGVWDGIQGVFSAVADVLGGFFSAAWSAVTGVWEAATGFFQGIWDGITGIFQGVADWFGNLFSQAWEAITSAWSGVGEFFSGIWDTITGFFSNAWQVFSDIGGNIVKGLWSGITGLAGWLWDNISGWVQSIWDGVLNFFGIHSPSKKAEWAFNMLMEGSAKGVEKNGYKAVRAVEDVSAQVMDALRTDPMNIDFSPRPVGWEGASSGAGKSSGEGASSLGGTTIIINSPVAVDPVQAAREWKKTSQQMALGFV